MKLNIYAIYDSKIEAYMQPFFMRTKGEALRAWEELANDSKSNISKHPADFTLFEIGEYDDQTGAVKANEARVNIGNALEWVKGEEDKGQPRLGWPKVAK